MSTGLIQPMVAQGAMLGCWAAQDDRCNQPSPHARQLDLVVVGGEGEDGEGGEDEAGEGEDGEDGEDEGGEVRVVRTTERMERTARGGGGEGDEDEDGEDDENEEERTTRTRMERARSRRKGTRRPRRKGARRTRTGDDAGVLGFVMAPAPNPFWSRGPFDGTGGMLAACLLGSSGGDLYIYPAACNPNAAGCGRRRAAAERHSTGDIYLAAKFGVRSRVDAATGDVQRHGALGGLCCVVRRPAMRLRCHRQVRATGIRALPRPTAVRVFNLQRTDQPLAISPILRHTHMRDLSF